MRRHPGNFALVCFRDDEEDHSELAALLHPAGAFAHPQDVVHDPDLTPAEKRAILSSWAARICAGTAVPAAGRPQGAPMIAFDDVADALHQLHRARGGRARLQPHYRQVLAQRVPGVFMRKPSNARGGTLLN
jgi:hypothetical protein